MKPLHLLVATVVAALLCVGAVPTTEAKEVRKPDIARYAEYAKSSVRIQRRVDDKPKTFGNGVVVRCRALAPSLEHYEVAVFLNDMTEEDRERLADFVSSAEAAAG